MVLLDKELQWVNVKKAIHTDVGILRHNQGIFRDIQNPV